MEKLRVTNGYGIRTSTLSASVIGRFDASSEKRKAMNRALGDRYNKDSAYQMSRLRGHHPVRKVLHMQKCYPYTVQRLNDKGGGSVREKTSSTARPISSRWHRNPSPNNRNTSPSDIKPPPLHNHPPRQEKGRLSLSPSTPTRRGKDEGGGVVPPTSKEVARRSKNKEGDVVSSEDVTTRRQRAYEYHFCHDKMAYNRTKGGEAEVDGIITGRSPLDKKMPLFPSNATHQQLLGLVYRASHPDKPAPAVPKRRKWLGDNVGWEGNRGLPTPPAGRNAKDGEVHPWPSSQHPSFSTAPS